MRTVLRALGDTTTEIARDTRVSVRTIERALGGQQLAAESWQRLTDYTRRRAGQRLDSRRHTTTWQAMTTTAILATYLQHHRAQRLCECGCGLPLSGRQTKYAANAHRQAANRRRTTDRARTSEVQAS